MARKALAGRCPSGQGPGAAFSAAYGEPAQARRRTAYRPIAHSTSFVSFPNVRTGHGSPQICANGLALHSW